ncbi:magnesium transporter [Enterococcus pallens]|uniref:Magnesium transporter MgtE n=1 Tax=Enterococcus pallens ATCC BAA-351 TaxID=1158607 RepID=R2SI54_9ENTE|nr:magnesium transporter [Enterococcus pallens]EOH87874.1 magnesium transporter mgtE [Enterococcus pallens ATCC BAA-351]EOU18088.1 magnesium transporter mgtE [Enterococcus pallens ATCC BAA-351]OJG82289.1 magnesium transporter mgtE [Enterococcus pallens]
MDENQEELEAHFLQLKSELQKNDLQDFREHFLEMHIYDQGQFYQSLDGEERQLVYSYMSPKELADMFDVIEEDDEHVEEYLSEMRPRYAADMLSEMYTDNAVDIFNELDKKQVAKYLSLMEPEHANEIRELLHYEDDTAGSIMTTEFVSIVANQTVRSAMYVLKKEAQIAETIYYTYVVNTENQLVGVISLRDLIINDDDTMVSEVMSERVISVHVGDDQEDVAQMFRDYDFLALPVTDYEDHLLGIVTVDDIIDVIDDEAASDYSGLAGVNVEEVDENPIKSASRRLPWLITLLFLGMTTASLINHYEALVSKASILAVFISLITGTAGNAGTQSLAVAVRRIAMSDDKDSGFGRLIIGEILTGLVTGLVTGATIFIIVGIWKHNFVLGFVIGTAMVAAITVANLAGSLIPMVMEKLGFDPAVASGPFITTLSDLTSVLIYFNIASLFMEHFIGS